MVYDIDGDGTVQQGSDGILIFRYFAGFRGTALITGAVDTGATRKTVGQIEGYLEKVWPQMDVCEDGDVDYGDVLLILRYLQDFPASGPQWTLGCITGNALRRTNAEIEAYILKMVT